MTSTQLRFSKHIWKIPYCFMHILLLVFSKFSLKKKTFYFRIQKYDEVRNQKNSHFRKMFHCM